MQILIECIGWLGATIVLIAFFLISTNRVDAHNKAYHWLNIVGAIGLIIHTTFNAAYPSAFVNIIWVIVAIYSLVKISTKK
jgi:formate hydrogenlyase subunit 3/multisubunit Na+/H+ antiporter MnhD subunit